MCIDREKQTRTIKEKYVDIALNLLINHWSKDPILACGDRTLSPFWDSTEDRQDIDRYVVGNDLKNRRECSTHSKV